MTAPTKSNLPAVANLSDDDITRFLQSSGYAEIPQATNRLKLNGIQFSAGDDIYISNPKTGAPAFLARILSSPIEYQGAWFDQALADSVGRPSIADSFCKSFFNIETQARKYAEDGTACTTCPIQPFMKYSELTHRDGDGKLVKCKWRGAIELQILDEDGTLSDETVWTMDLSTTGVIEFKGTAKKPVAGSASQYNFMHKLLSLGASLTPDNPGQGVAQALAALEQGGVIAEVRSLNQSSEDGSINWNTPSFTPVKILDIPDAAPALPAGDTDGDVDDNLPF